VRGRSRAGPPPSPACCSWNPHGIATPRRSPTLADTRLTRLRSRGRRRLGRSAQRQAGRRVARRRPASRRHGGEHLVRARRSAARQGARARLNTRPSLQGVKRPLASVGADRGFAAERVWKGVAELAAATEPRLRHLGPPVGARKSKGSRRRRSARVSVRALVARTPAATTASRRPRTPACSGLAPLHPRQGGHLFRSWVCRRGQLRSCPDPSRPGRTCRLGPRTARSCSETSVCAARRPGGR
jgi:hypothetical protein